MSKKQYILKLFLFSLTTISILGIQDISAQRKKKRRSKNKIEVKQKKKKAEKTITELTKSSKKFDGLFPIYQDTISGDLKLIIKEKQLNKDYIYFSQIADGITEIQTFRGSYRGSTILNIKKHFNKIEFISPNTAFYFDKTNPISKSSRANISDAIITSTKILSSNTKTGEYLIDANALFISELLTRIKPPNFPGRPPFAFKLGSFDKKKSKISEIKNYPENTNIKTEYVYNNPSVLNGGSQAIKDGRFISIKVFHTFMNMPESDYESRMDDPRVGYFLTTTNDMTSTKAVNYRDFIHRWKLIKKNPELAISEPVKPITWWIENSTPIEFIETIKEGVLAWNEAFEKAGFKNAMEIKVQPEDADWDAGDVRYNVLRWTSSPNPPFGGYGPSFVNPRTGEILGADIMLEYVHFTNRVKYDKIFSSVSNTSTQEEAHNIFALKDNHMFCSAGHLMHENTMFGKAVLAASGASDLEMEGMKREAMKALIMHEVGHTLGLNHNMKASQLFSPEQLADADFIEGKCLTGSVMDYAAINLTLDRSKQGQYYDTAVGPYDVWAIQYGYTPFNNDSERKALLAQSTKPELIFGNDADDMRAPGKAIDPRVMIGDLSNDQIAYSIDRIKLANNIMKDIKSRFSNEGETYEELRNAYYILSSQAATAGGVISRFIGGVYVDRSVIGQEGGTQPYTPVSLADQKRAMDALKTYVFAPNTFKAPADLYNYLARQRRGYNFFSGPEDPKIHAQVLRYQKNVLNHILHRNTLQRITDSELYGNQYTLSAFMTDLNNAIFKADLYKNVNSFRQNLQTEYTKILLNMVVGKKSKGYTNAAKAMALYNLNKIKSWVSSATGNISTKAHKNQLKLLINNSLKEVK